MKRNEAEQTPKITEMSQSSFEYDPDRIQECALSPSHDQSCCRELYRSYLQHYYDSPDDIRKLKDENYDYFLKSVRFVHQHNTKQQQQQQQQQQHKHFTLTLNQFSNQPPRFTKRRLEQAQNQTKMDTHQQQHFRQQQRVLRRKQSGRHHQQGTKEVSTPPPRLILPKKLSKPFSTIELPPSAIGLEVQVEPPTHRRGEEDEFRYNLNWATTLNPDGIPLVHDVFDQVGNIDQ